MWAIIDRFLQSAIGASLNTHRIRSGGNSFMSICFPVYVSSADLRAHRRGVVDRCRVLVRGGSGDSRVEFTADVTLVVLNTLLDPYAGVSSRILPMHEVHSLVLAGSMVVVEAFQNTSQVFEGK